MTPRRYLPALLLLFVGSGCAALIYEVVWFQLLQLVIGDPWFAWLQQLSGLIVRIDEVTGSEARATEADAKALFEQVDRLLIPSETGADFARRYFEALQRQPAVVLAHGDVKRVLKNPSA